MIFKIEIEEIIELIFLIILCLDWNIARRFVGSERSKWKGANEDDEDSDWETQKPISTKRETA